MDEPERPAPRTCPGCGADLNVTVMESDDDGEPIREVARCLVCRRGFQWIADLPGAADPVE